MIGFAITASYCTISGAIEVMEELVSEGYELVPIMSENAYSTDTRFGEAKDIVNRVQEICGREVIHSIVDAEPIGPRMDLEALVICPCTGNTLAKMANGITDTPVCMAAKAQLRNNKPVVISLATNDAMSANLKNIATLLSRKNVYFTPMMQDDPIYKPHSLVAEVSLVKNTLRYAINGKQYPKIFI